MVVIAFCPKFCSFLSVDRIPFHIHINVEKILMLLSHIRHVKNCLDSLNFTLFFKLTNQPSLLKLMNNFIQADKKQKTAGSETKSIYSRSRTLMLMPVIIPWLPSP